MLFSTKVAKMEFGTQEAVEITRATRRMLHWWAQRDIVRPSRGKRGHQRYTAMDLLVVRVLLDLRWKGMSLRLACAHANSVRHLRKPLYFLIHGDNRSFLSGACCQIVNEASRSPSHVYLIDIATHVSQIEAWCKNKGEA